MTTGQPVPTNQNCPGCSALVFYEGHSELRSTLTPHRFHCHQCGKVFVVRSTSHKPPKFRITDRHEVQEAAAPEGLGHIEELGSDDDDLDDDEHLLLAEAQAAESLDAEAVAEAIAEVGDPEIEVESEAERSAGPTDS
jgi:ribosomal protein S27AE